jgi:tetratricopeptide (TPR) repeat protein
MPDKVFLFRLNGYLLGVEQDQIEKILINKHPSRNSFTLETGAEVKRLADYIPLPSEGEQVSENILFVQDQKNFNGFSVDKVQGYLKLKGSGKVNSGPGKSPIKYFVKSDEALIPVLDLQYITNTENVVGSNTIEEIVQTSKANGEVSGDRSGASQEISEEEIYRSIDDEINKKKSESHGDDIISSEKRGVVLPLVLNVVILAIFAGGLSAYMLINKERTREQILGANVSGVEEEVIKEIRRRSEEEVAEQREKLKNARNRLTALQQERDQFLENQDEILSEREALLNAEYQKKLEEARLRIMASGTGDSEVEFAKEREKLRQEYLALTDEARAEIDSIKNEYEDALANKEEEINREVVAYSERIDDIEQKLVEEQAKLKEAEERFQSALSTQQEYLAFRKQLNNLYDTALTQISEENYAQGVAELNKIPPIIENARNKGVGEEAELRVEDRLVSNILNLAEKGQNRVNLNQIARSTYNSAVDLENMGNLNEALSRFFTVYTIADDNRLERRALNRAESVMDQIFKARNEGEARTAEAKTDALFDNAMTYKGDGEYNRALGTLEEIIVGYPGTPRAKESLDQIKDINSLIAEGEEQDRIEVLNREASQAIRNAEESYESGFLTEAVDKYSEVVSRFQGSEYVDDALTEIVKIGEIMRSMGTSPQVVMTGEGAKTGVIIQIASENSFLFNLGKEDGMEKGDVLGIYRKEEETFVFIGSVKISEVYPTVSKGRIMFFERPFKVGDVVSPS